MSTVKYRHDGRVYELSLVGTKAVYAVPAIGQRDDGGDADRRNAAVDHYNKHKAKLRILYEVRVFDTVAEPTVHEIYANSYSAIINRAGSIAKRTGRQTDVYYSLERMPGASLASRYLTTLFPCSLNRSGFRMRTRGAPGTPVQHTAKF